MTGKDDVGDMVIVEFNRSVLPNRRGIHNFRGFAGEVLYGISDFFGRGGPVVQMRGLYLEQIPLQ